MSIGGDDDDDTLETGAEGQGTEGQDDGHEGDGGKEADLSPEHADEEADDGEQEIDGAARKPPSRGEARFQRLANETRAAREDAAAARREAEDLRRQSWQQNSQVTEQQERERLALMTAEERADYKIDKFQRDMAGQRQQDRINNAATMDKVAFDAKATINPVYARHKDEVEAKFQEQLRQGRPVEREILLKMILGERALNGAAAGGKARRQARARVDGQRVAAGSGKGDAASDRGRAGNTPESRLKGMTI